MNSWPEGAMLPGTRVRVVRDTDWDGPWEREFTGVLSPNVAPTPSRNPRAPKGELSYFVVFDEPQIDCDGCGPYSKAMIRSRYIRVDLHGGWVVPAAAPRPSSTSMRVFGLDMVAQPDLRVTPEPNAMYRVSLPGIEADYYTDAAGRARYFETVPGTEQVPNQVLGVAAAGATYVVHPLVDGRFSVVLRTDDQARLVEVVADPLAPEGSFGAGGHPLAGLLGGWPGQVSLFALLGSLGASAVDGLGRLGAWLADAVGRGRTAGVRLQVIYDGVGSVPARVQAEWSVDGQTATESFVNT